MATGSSFCLKRFLSTTLTPILKGEQMKEEEQASSFIPVVKSSSENKV